MNIIIRCENKQPFAEAYDVITTATLSNCLYLIILYIEILTVNRGSMSKFKEIIEGKIFFLLDVEIDETNDYSHKKI